MHAWYFIAGMRSCRCMGNGSALQMEVGFSTHPRRRPGPTIEMWVSKSMKNFISVFYSRSQTATGLDKSLQAIAFPRETLTHGNKTRNTLHLRKQSVICGPQKKVEYKQWPHTLNSGSQNRLWFQPNCDPFKYRLINSIPREQRPPEEELRCMTMIPWTLMQWLSSVNWITDIGFGYQVDCMKTLHSKRLSTVTVPHPSNKIHYETKLTTGSEKV